MAEIIKFPYGPTSLVPCKVVLQGALQADLEDVLVIGTEKNGESFVSCSYGNVGKVLYLMERAKEHLMALAEEHPQIR